MFFVLLGSLIYPVHTLCDSPLVSTGCFACDSSEIVLKSSVLQHFLRWNLKYLSYIKVSVNDISDKQNVICLKQNSL